MAHHLKYKNYYGSVNFNKHDRVLFGEIIGIKDLVTYEAKNIEELIKHFEESVEDYLKMCQTLKKAPDKFLRNFNKINK